MEERQKYQEMCQRKARLAIFNVELNNRTLVNLGLNLMNAYLFFFLILIHQVLRYSLEYSFASL